MKKILYNFKNVFFFIVVLLITNQLNAQDGADKYGNHDTFGASRIGLTQSVEPLTKGVLDFEIQHQFGPINSGISEFFGLDQAVTRLGLVYGITDWLTVGYGRTGLDKSYNGSVKARIISQGKENGFPFTLSYYGNIGAYTTSWNYDNVPYYLSHRFTYVNQLLIARKFGDRLSVQLSPTIIHRNFVGSKEADNDVYDIGVAARYLVGEKFGFTFDYHYLLSSYTASNYNNSLTIGVNILTAGHVFSLFATNSNGMIEQQFIPTTEGSWLKGDIHFGFTIVRSFTLIEPDYF
jgi:hypothetical protein